jgi:hypothetical protein
MNKVPLPVIGGLVGGAIGMGVGLFLQKTKQKQTVAPFQQKQSGSSSSSPSKLSPESKDIMEQMDAFKKLPEYHALFSTIEKLEQYHHDVTTNPKKYSKSQVTSDTSRYVARATRLLDALVAKNRNVNPLDLQSDTEAVKKIIDDLKHNLYQQAGLLASSPSSL